MEAWQPFAFLSPIRRRMKKKKKKVHNGVAVAYGIESKSIRLDPPVEVQNVWCCSLFSHKLVCLATAMGVAVAAASPTERVLSRVKWLFVHFEPLAVVAPLRYLTTSWGGWFAKSRRGAWCSHLRRWPTALPPSPPCEKTVIK